MADVKTIRVKPEVLARVKRVAFAESSTEGDFVSIGETIERMVDFWERENATRSESANDR